MASPDEIKPDEEKVEKIKKRVALEEKAYRIVVQLTDATPSEKDLSILLQSLSTEHYDDIVEERSVCKLCGYPLCANILNNDWKQKYWISTKTKTVYDVSERKKFCSNYCMTASHHLRKQISSSPVWLRDNEAPVEISFLPKTDKCGVPGKVVATRLKKYTGITSEVQELEKLDANRIQSTDDDSQVHQRRIERNVCRSDESEMESGSEMEEECNKVGVLDECALPDWQEDFERELVRRMNAVPGQPKREAAKEVVEVKSSVPMPSRAPHVPSRASHVPEEKLKSVLELLAKKRKDQVKMCLIDVPWDAPSASHAGKEQDATSSIAFCSSPKSAEKRAQSPFASSAVSSVNPSNQAVSKLKGVLLDWRTLESVKLMTRLDSVPLPDRTSKELPKNPDDWEDARPKKGRPGFKKLRFEDAEQCQMKVDADQYGVKVKRFLGENPQVTSEVDDSEIILPPVHSCSQMTLRRKIVLDKLSGALPTIINVTSLSMAAVATSVRQLVNTFNLTSHNILLSHNEWTAVGFVLLKVLSTKDVCLVEQLGTEPATNLARALLASVELNDSDVEEIVCRMTRLSSDEKRELDLSADCSVSQSSPTDRDVEMEIALDDPYDELD